MLTICMAIINLKLNKPGSRLFQKLSGYFFLHILSLSGIPALDEINTTNLQRGRFK